MGAYGHDPGLVRPSALSHLFVEESAETPFKHNIRYEGDDDPDI